MIPNQQHHLPIFYLGFVVASLKLRHFLEPNMQ